MTRVPSTLPIVRGRKTMEMLSASPGASVVALKEEGWKCTLSVVTEKTESSVSAPLFSSAISTAGMQRGLCLNSKLGGSIETREAEVMARGVADAASARSAPEQLSVATAAARDHHQSGGPRRGAGRDGLDIDHHERRPLLQNLRLTGVSRGKKYTTLNAKSCGQNLDEPASVARGVCAPPGGRR